jgi:hypothetical protein
LTIVMVLICHAPLVAAFHACKQSSSTSMPLRPFHVKSSAPIRVGQLGRNTTRTLAEGRLTSLSVACVMLTGRLASARPTWSACAAHPLPRSCGFYELDGLECSYQLAHSTGPVHHDDLLGILVCGGLSQGGQHLANAGGHD